MNLHRTVPAYLLGVVSILAGCASAEARTSSAPARPSAPEAIALEPVGRQAAEGPEGDPAAAVPILRATLSHAAYARSVPDRLALKIDVVAPSGSEAALRPPIDVVLAIDQSGSMAEGRKFEFALRAAGVVIDALSERDRFALVAFADQAIVLSPTGRVVNKEFLTHRLTEIAPGGWTNLSAGLLEAYAQHDDGAGSSDGEHRGQHVIVLTDGKANRGVSDPAQLRTLVERARQRGISVSTMGVGAEFDGQLLIGLAEAGGGRYTYAKEAEDIPGAMAAEVGGLLQVVAQNAVLRVRVTDSTDLVRVFGRAEDSPRREQVFPLGDLRLGERGTFVFELKPTSFAGGATAGVEAELTYDDVARATREKATAEATATFTADAAQAAKGGEPTVALHAEVLDALEQAEEAVAGLDEKHANDAAGRFDGLYKRVREAALAAGDQQLLNHAFLLKHFAEEILAASRTGQLHGHAEARAQFKKEAEYRRYLLGHHR